MKKTQTDRQTDRQTCKIPSVRQSYVRWLVGRAVGRSGNAFVRRSTRRTLLAYLTLFSVVSYVGNNKNPPISNTTRFAVLFIGQKRSSNSHVVQKPIGSPLTCLSVCLSVCMTACLSVWLPTCPSLCKTHITTHFKSDIQWHSMICLNALEA